MSDLLIALYHHLHENNKMGNSFSNRTLMKDSIITPVDLRKINSDFEFQKSVEKKKYIESKYQEIKEKYHHINEDDILNSARTGKFRHTIVKYGSGCDYGMEESVNRLDNEKYKDLRWGLFNLDNECIVYVDWVDWAKKFKDC